jgi:carboxypeptidase C (cathepsin A)
VFPGNTYDYTFYNSTIENQVFDSLYGEGNCTDQIIECNASGDDQVCANADDFCFEYVEYPYDTVSGRDEYDMRELTPDPFPYEFYVDYLNRPDVLAAIGAYTNFTEFSAQVGDNFYETGDDARDPDTAEDLRTLLKDGVTVALYAGDADYICNWIGVEAVAAQVNPRRWDKAGYVDLSTSDGIVHAQVKQAGKFSFTRVFEAGHEVPFYQPLAALEMFDRVINGLDVATGTRKIGNKSCYVTKGTAKSEYREGNATVQFEVLPPNSTYDPSVNGPGAPWKAKSHQWARNHKLARLERRRAKIQGRGVDGL